MPTDLLLPAFALTLLANAVLIAVAIRGLRRGRTDPTPTKDWFVPVQATRPPAIAPEPGAAAGLAPASLDPVADAAPPAAHADPASPSDPAVATAGPAPSSVGRRHGPARERSAPVRTRAVEPATRRSRRKFSLPPIDDDHEKVNRSIESFLAGSDATADPTGPNESAGSMGGDAPPRATSGARVRADGASGPIDVPTTIALVAIAGLGDPATPANRDGAGDRATNDPVAMLERTLRGAARAGDEVHPAGNGRFRIVLPATGELAARAYLRRIRATVEPQLEAADRPLHFVVATATALNVPIRSATITARRRLEAAIIAHPVGAGPAGPLESDGTDDAVDDNVEPKPRAAGD